MNALYLLSVGIPTPTPSRFGTSSVLRLGQEYLMFDCGPATTHKLVKAGILPTQISTLFFTHHHSDHNADYPCFFLCRFDQSTGKETPLRIYGPQPTVLFTERLFGKEGAFYWDINARLNHPASQALHKNRGGLLPRPGPAYEVANIGPETAVKGTGWEVTAARAQHQEPWLDSLAYRVDSNEGSVVFLGDTEPCESVAGLASGADVLVVNLWDLQETMEASDDSGGQIGARDAGRLAQEAGAAKVVCTHIGPTLAKPDSREKVIAEIGQHYHGEIIFGEELMVLQLFAESDAPRRE